ncbi:MAG: glycoside hydrolase family 3 C-terminal domain-containing protein [Pseudobutyrivibrio sp.]|uniref:glycoside hydrolase family 3 C-terminal domain-containing protein n=1 Tax=Pseudobutyrivibrio sp. TaxID=2014367 RepID=UPI0025F6E5C0|nr:glycoside hydrolase family 3 C-terminal domain-containing protein [Pseudobutyrivibrio sp.]MBQ6462789.1 glycoside hydrolase family 3 C-terminal domain-containing protein [Pseudobutyrivibrio sp.]
MGSKRKSGKVFSVLGIIFLILAIVITGAGNYFGGILDTYIGLGEAVMVQKPGSENWDTEYYTTDFATAEEIDKSAKDVTKRIAEEGITLLKNNGELPLSKGQSVSLFGRRSVDTIWGGTGSGSGDANQCTTLQKALMDQGFNVNDTLTKLYADNLDKVEVGNNTMDKLSALTYYIGEFPMSYYDSSITASYSKYNDAAIVVIGRQGGEGMDFSTNLKESISSGETAMSADVAETKNYEDGQHQLELSKEEKDMISHVEENFDRVILVVNSSNVMELGDLQDDENIDAILWMAYPGSRGTVALAEILNGTINPSGHTVDTWPRDLTKDPTFVNTTTKKYSNIDGYTVEYEEGIYVGYRWYETAAADGVIDYDSSVVYPFGYGLSYTSFSQEIKEVVEDGDNINVTVSVTNTGEIAGKDIIQVYYHAPYNGDIEKAEAVLAAYDKTDEINPGETKDYTVSFTKESMASFDYKNNGCYVLDEGTYTLSLRKNSHELYGENCEYELTVDAQVVYNEGNPRATEVEAQTGDAVNYSDEWKSNHEVIAATTKFDEQNAHFENGKATILSRADFEGTMTSAPTADDLKADDSVAKNFEAYKPDYYDSADEAPVTGAKNKLNAVALRGATYDDPRWEELLDEMTVKEMTELIYSGNQGTIAVSSISLPQSTATDGPAGLKQYGGLGFGASGNFNCCGTLVAATWNEDLATEYGITVGNEAVIAEVDGWYAPGCDLHRTAFGGRNFEYYSEDPLISGKTCAATIKGTSSKGLTTMFKHFALNDVETHRIENGPCVWANEQAMRELYLKAFEIAIKEPVTEIKYLDAEGNSLTKTIRGSVGVMSSFNRIGSVWSGACGSLMNGVLRDEWGFLGTVITDYNGNAYMNVEWGVTNGNDLMLANASTLPSKFADTSNPSTQKYMRQACKNIIYMHVNSNTVNHLSDGTTIEYKMAPWRMAMYGVIALFAILGIVFIILGHKKKQKNVIKVEVE